ncbi:MAG TPA: hypothetical protein ENI67_04860 [Gammaproteobacteria bacterium]|nr:hypothetical protein [Gammaproteobacteria bacterium]
MPAPATPLLQTTATSIRALFEPAFKQLLEQSSDSDKSELAETGQAMVQALLVIDRTSSAEDVLNENDVNQIRDFLFSLLARFVSRAGDKQLPEVKDSFQRLYIPFSLWITEQQGTLIELEPVVDAFASFANQQHDTGTLSELSTAIGKILAAVPAQIREDIVDRNNPGRPWRILNLNRGIVATRSHNPEIMRQAYSDLVNNIPEDAREFFNEGQKQMEIVDYPDHVKEILQQYNDLWGGENALH